MGFRFRKSVKIMPGVRVNFSKSGASWSLGGKGASINVGPRGVYGNVGIPGSGISFRERLDKPGQRSTSSRAAETVDLALRLSIGDDGYPSVGYQDGRPLEPGVEKVVKKQITPHLRQLVADAAAQEAQVANELLELHLLTPSPMGTLEFRPEPFLEREPYREPLQTPGFWARLLPPLKRKVEAKNEVSVAAYERAVAAWQSQREAHEQRQESRRRVVDGIKSGELNKMEAALEELLSRLNWPRETLVNFQMSSASKLLLDVDLPEIEDLPTRSATASAKCDRLLYKDLSETAKRSNYVQHVHSIGFRLVGEAFAALPTLESIVVSGYSQRPDKKTGHINDDYLYSAIVRRDLWQQGNFTNLRSLDVVAAFERFELRREMSKTGVFKPVAPFTAD